MGTYERADLESLLDLKLKPIYIAIEKLENTQEQMANVLTNQAVQNEKITTIKAEVEKCLKTHDEVFTRLRTIENDVPLYADTVKRVAIIEKASGNKMWEIIKIGLVALGSLFIGLLTRKAIG